MNASPLIRAGPAQNVCSWSAHGPRMVRGVGRTAFFLKVSPAGLACGPITSCGQAAGHPFPLSLQVLLIFLNFTSFARLPSQFPGMSLNFLPLHCRFSSLHFLEDSFICTPFPFRFRCPGRSPSRALAFSCILVSLQRPPHFRAIPLTFILFTSPVSLHFLFSPLFRIAAKKRSFCDSAGRCYKIPPKSVKQIRKPGGPSAKRMRVVRSWSAHGRRRLEVSPAGLSLPFPVSPMSRC